MSQVCMHDGPSAGTALSCPTLCTAAAAAASAAADSSEADLLGFGACEAQKAQPAAVVVGVEQADDVVHLLPAVLVGLDGHEHRVEVVHVAELVCTQAAAESVIVGTVPELEAESRRGDVAGLRGLRASDSTRQHWAGQHACSSLAARTAVRRPGLVICRHMG